MLEQFDGRRATGGNGGGLLGGTGAEALVHELGRRVDLAVLPVDGLPLGIVLDLRFKFSGLRRRDLAVDVEIQ